jgi:hypothetical protein
VKLRDQRAADLVLSFREQVDSSLPHDFDEDAM